MDQDKSGTQDKFQGQSSCQPSQKGTNQLKIPLQCIRELKVDNAEHEKIESNLKMWIIKKLSQLLRKEHQRLQIPSNLDNIGQDQKSNLKALLLIIDKDQSHIINDLKINLAKKLMILSMSEEIQIGIPHKLQQELLFGQKKQTKENQPLKQIPMIDLIGYKIKQQTEGRANNLHITNQNVHNKEKKQTNENQEVKGIPTIQKSYQDSAFKTSQNKNKQIQQKDAKKDLINPSPYSKSRISQYRTPRRLKYKQKQSQQTNQANFSEQIIMHQYQSKSNSTKKLRINSSGRVNIYYNDDTSFDIKTYSKKSNNQQQQKMKEKEVREQSVKPYLKQKESRSKARNIQKMYEKENNKNLKNVKKIFKKVIKQQFQQILQKKIKVQKIQNNPQLVNNIQEIKKLQWYKYLECLSFAQTQVSYVTQHMGFTCKFLESVSSQSSHNMYCCTVQVGRLQNGIYKKYIGVCQGQKSKKQARHHASVLCLAELYSRNESLWQNFKEKKQYNAFLTLPLKSDNTLILDNWWKIIKPEQIHASKVQNQKQYLEKPQIENYIKGLKSFKHQLYYFIAQNNKIFMPPRWCMRKPNIQGFWQAEGVIRYEIKGNIYEYRFKSRGKTKKECQQLVSQNFLRQIYTDFPMLFKKYKIIKMAKGLV